MKSCHSWAILLAAGQGSRLAACTKGLPKQFFKIDHKPLYWYSLYTLSKVARLRGVVVVFPADCMEEKEQLQQLMFSHNVNLPVITCIGGARRQDSVRNALEHIPATADTVLIHDAARPFATAELWNRILDALCVCCNPPSGVIPALSVVDTIKEVDEHNRVCATLDRTVLKAVQTPQGFALATLRKAHAQAVEHEWDVTDDASLLERCGHSVLVVDGEGANTKLTRAEDMTLLQSLHSAPSAYPVTGYGYDVHRFAGHTTLPKAQPERPLRLGGVDIPNSPFVLAHSDGDVLLHALTDAVLGCLGEGDIGSLFPDTDSSLDNMDSAVFLEHALTMARTAGLMVHHVDLTVITQTPKVAPHRAAIRKNIARLLGLDIGSVNIKATTEEGLGFTGKKEGIKAVALVNALKPVYKDTF